jgi:uncharacterized coiled-coil DUF342 family protein
MDTAMHILGKLAPPDVLVHVGAGNGHGPLHQWQNWPFELAVVIDGDSKKLAWAKAKASHNPWHVLAQVVGKKTESITWYHASISRESGLLAPETLNDLWPNLSTQTQEEVTATTLAACLEQTPFSKTSGQVWAILDCLPALPILQGAENIMADWQVIVARVLLPAQDASDRQDASLKQLEAWLAPRGFECLQTVETLHPDLGYCFFARNWPKELRGCAQERSAKTKKNQELTRERDEKEKQIQDLTQDRDNKGKQVQDLTKERDAKAKESNDRQERIKKIKAENEQANAKVNELQAQLQELTKQRDAKAQEASGKHKQLDELAQAKSQLEKDLAARTKERDAKAKQIQDLTQDRDNKGKQVQDLTKERDAKAKESNDRQEQIKKIQAENEQIHSKVNELEQHKKDAIQKQQHMDQQAREDSYRQQQLQEELTRAEAQIELIKDLLLREQGL